MGCPNHHCLFFFVHLRCLFYTYCCAIAIDGLFDIMRDAIDCITDSAPIDNISCLRSRIDQTRFHMHQPAGHLPLLAAAALLPAAVPPERQLHHLVEVLGERSAQRRQLIGRAVLERLHLGHLEAPDGVVHLLHGRLGVGGDRRKGVPEVLEQLVERQVEVAQLLLDVGADELCGVFVGVCVIVVGKSVFRDVIDFEIDDIFLIKKLNNCRRNTDIILL